MEFGPGPVHSDHTFWDDKKAQRQKVNRRVNLFMRDLYRAVVSEKKEPGFLKNFFESLKTDGIAKIENGILKIDPEKLEDTVQ